MNVILNMQIHALKPAKLSILFSRPTAEDGTTEVVEMEGEAPEKDDNANKDEDKQRAYLTPTAVRDHMRLIWANEQGVLREVFGALNVKADDNSDSCPTDVFFLEVVPVVPSRFRPVSKPVVLLMESRNGEIMLKLTFRRYPAIRTNYIISHCTTLQYNHNI